MERYDFENGCGMHVNLMLSTLTNLMVSLKNESSCNKIYWIILVLSYIGYLPTHT